MPDEGAALVGNVVRLHREGVGAGQITIAGNIEGDDRLRRVWLSLADEDYARAVDAHSRGMQVSVRGDLVKQGNRLYMVNASSIQFMDAGD